MAAIEEVNNNLSTGADLEEGQHNLLMLCIALTFYQYALIEAQNQAESVRVGDVSVSNDKQKLLDAAKQLKNHYLQATKRYMKSKFVEFKMI
jgi:4-diphosphocytidyl-2C-methyl-D-erythritol kinase